MKHLILKRIRHALALRPASFLVACFSFALMLAAQAQTATVEGNVTLPKPKATPPASERYGLKAGQVAPAPAPVAVIYLEGQFAGTTNAVKTNRMQMAQKGFQFTQSILPVQKGS